MPENNTGSIDNAVAQSPRQASEWRPPVFVKYLVAGGFALGLGYVAAGVSSENPELKYFGIGMASAAVSYGFSTHFISPIIVRWFSRS